MTARISGSVGSYQSGAKNNGTDISTVQELLTAAAIKLHKSQFDPGGIDGKIARIAERSGTVQAIAKFQREQVGINRPDNRIDVAGKTWNKLVQVVGSVVPKKPTPIRPVTLTVSHSGLVPTGTIRGDGQPVGTHDGPYESTFVLSGGLTGSFRGSIWPNDMTQRGHLVDASYPLHIGFHKGGGAAKQKAENLVIKTSGIRAALLVNMRNSVAVSSDKASKTTATGVNIHNGLNSTKRSSDGCPNILPSDWSRFIKLFLDAYPNISDWHAEYKNTGKKVGTLIVQP